MLFRLLGLCLIVAALAATFRLWPQTQTIKVSAAELQSALQSKIKTAPDIGFIPRARFEYLNWDFETGLKIAGSARWYSVNGGSFARPDISLSANVPIDPKAWSISAGGLNISDVVIQSAYREPFDATPGRNESEANLLGWQKALTKLLADIGPFGGPQENAEKWKILSVEQDQDGLVFQLKR